MMEYDAERSAEYRVILETTAIEDMRGILDYIADVLKQPETAERLLYSIEDQIMSLDHMPARYSLVNDEFYASQGVRLMPVENYLAFYTIDEAAREVRVIRVLYNRREWQNLL